MCCQSWPPTCWLVLICFYEYGVTIDVGRQASFWGRSGIVVPSNLLTGAPRTIEVAQPPTTTSQSDGMGGLQTIVPRWITRPLSGRRLIYPEIFGTSYHEPPLTVQQILDRARFVAWQRSLARQTPHRPT